MLILTNEAATVHYPASRGLSVKALKRLEDRRRSTLQVIKGRLRRCSARVSDTTAPGRCLTESIFDGAEGARHRPPVTK